ncbi:pyridoxamine 5'-phosphate oxidase family protein [Falsiroseomonas selenitidurans]|uniref:Pyridoxamine 5'-phosphate oxidase family protein n=1 Tax=Falsiroseomonas selenitidurans TaxID=2716335 RepID=A0ABX1E7F6_9PROT|nr:pyridoxamine 5'-phosphate oxidase family protein [Falsiroseomonas selenitidurans]NKC33121.1 pyridoxamine 5'-phosphate oxidase family protein [Falsiroseomonas selenitidurans]
MTQTRTDQAARDKVWELIRDIEVATLVTVDAEGHLRGRPMRAVETEQFDGTLWFFTAAGSPKVEEIRQDERVLLAYAEPSDQNYVSISGTARVVRDAAQQKAMWSEPLRAWFPGGPEDPKAALLKVQVEGAEYWDAPSSTLLHAYGYVKARLGGEAPEAGENDKVAFKRPA